MCQQYHQQQAQLLWVNRRCCHGTKDHYDNAHTYFNHDHQNEDCHLLVLDNYRLRRPERHLHHCRPDRYRARRPHHKAILQCSLQFPE